MPINCKYTGHEEDFNCVKGSLKRAKCGWDIVGKSGYIYRIYRVNGKLWSEYYYDDSNNHQTMNGVLSFICNHETFGRYKHDHRRPMVVNPWPANAPKFKGKVTLTDGTNDEIKRLRAENKELNKTIVRLEDLAVKIDNKNQSLEGENAKKDKEIEQLKDDLVQLSDMKHEELSDRVAQIRKLEAACTRYKADIAALENSLSIYERMLNVIERLGE